MNEALSYPDDPFTEQVNVRMRQNPRMYVDRLARLNGETKQAFFDRLVAEEYERHVLEHGDAMITENEAQVAELNADIEEVRMVLANSVTP